MYQTGVTVSGAAMLGTLATFAAARGWIVDRNAVDGAGVTIHLHAGSSHFTFRGAPLAGELPSVLPLQDRQ